MQDKHGLVNDQQVAELVQKKPEGESSDTNHKEPTNRGHEKQDKIRQNSGTRTCIQKMTEGTPRAPSLCISVSTRKKGTKFPNMIDPSRYDDIKSEKQAEVGQTSRS